jgi:hypothetical protein
MRRLGQSPLPSVPTQPDLTAIAPAGTCFDERGQRLGALGANGAASSSTWWWWGLGLLVAGGLYAVSRGR